MDQGIVDPWGGNRGPLDQPLKKQLVFYADDEQSVTFRLETSRYRDFSQFFESIGLSLKNFGLKKKSRYQSRKYLVSKKVLVSGSDEISGLLTQW